MTVPELSRPAVGEALRYADTWLAFQARLHRVPGVQAAVLYDGDVLLSTAYGHADVEGDVGLTTAHLFRIASHSKTFTATAVLQLVDDGTVRLDDRAQHWIPSLEGTPAGPMTLRELLAHRSGLSRDSHDGDFWQLFRPFPDADTLVGILSADGVDVVPRHERFKYSNLAYGLLGLVIEAASGRPYGVQVRERILGPLGLRNTAADLDPDRAGDYAAGYSSYAYADRRVPIEHIGTGALAPATGFHCTAEDLVRYFAAHFLGDERILSDDAKREMQNAVSDAGPDGSRYGLGLAVRPVGDRSTIGHGGGYPGHSTSSVADPKARLAVSVLTNAVDGPAESLTTGVVKLIDLAAAKGRRGTDAQRFTGRFASLWGVEDVALLGGKLYMLQPRAADPTAAAVRLEPESGTVLRMGESSTGYASYGEPLVYDFRDNGTVRSVRGPSGSTLVPLDDLDLGDRVTAPTA